MPNPTDNPNPAPIKGDALPKIREAVAPLHYFGRDLKNNVANALHWIEETGCAYPERVAYAERALPTTLESIAALSKCIADTLPALRALTTGDAPAELAIEEGGFSIQTKYLPATNTRGSRIKAWRVDCDHNGKTESVTVSFDHGAGDPHDNAARAWIARHWKDDAKRKPIVRLFKGSAPAGRVYTVRF